MRSVPPRGSGWVSRLPITQAVVLMSFMTSFAETGVLASGPTRYREVVLTSWDHRLRDSNGK